MTARLPSSISIGQTATAVAVATTRPGHVIGIIGYTGAGKSTTAEVLKADGYTMASFGALIRAEVAQAWGISVNRMASSTGAKRQPQTLLAFGRCIDPYFKHAMARAGEVMGKPRSLISDHMTQDLHLIKADELVYADGTLKQAQHDLMQIVKGLQR